MTKTFRSNLKLSVNDMTIIGFIIVLWIVTETFLPINIGFMKIGFGFMWAMVAGLIFKPFHGILVAMISDNLTLLLTGSMQWWMWEYFLLYPTITIVTFLLKNILSLKSNMTYIINFVFHIVISILIITFIFVYKSLAESNRQLSILSSANIVIFGSLFATIEVISIVVFWYIKRNKEVNMYEIMNIYTMVLFITVIFSWFLGPILSIRWQQKHFNKTYAELFSIYELFIIPRILKTPFTLFVNTAIIYSIIKVWNGHTISTNYKW